MRPRPLELVALSVALWLPPACAQPRQAGLDPSVLLGAVRAGDHTGPPVKFLPTGPHDAVQLVFETFDREGALDLATFIDGFYREPGNEGYDAVIDRLETDLRAAGFGRKDGLELEIVETPMRHQAWTPREARLEILEDGVWRTLLAFDEKDDRARTMIPSYGPSCDVRGEVALSTEELEEGQILVLEDGLGTGLRAATKKKAAGVLSAWLADFCVDPTGEERHLDAIHYGKVRTGTELAVGHISPRVYARIAAAKERNERVELRYQARVDWRERPARTLIARVIGRVHPDQAVAVAAHVQEPGANDNASGVAGLATAARSLARAIDSGTLERPLRTLAMIWGDEMAMTRVYLDHTERTVVAGFSSDMTGPSAERTGAICLLERTPDPGAVVTLPPDEHSAWGAGQVREDRLRPNGLALVARCALADVAMLSDGWRSADHPWEGGSDHDVFLGRDIPAVLLWHFTDFAYHTSLDRLEHFDVDELRRTTAALVGAAWAVADPEPNDLERYLDSLQLARRVRLRAAEEAENEAIAEAWRRWFTGARHWLRVLCLDLPLDTPLPPEDTADEASDEPFDRRDDDR